MSPARTGGSGDELDVIEVLIREREDRNAVQVTGLDLLEGMNDNAVAAPGV